MGGDAQRQADRQRQTEGLAMQASAAAAAKNYDEASRLERDIAMKFVLLGSSEMGRLSQVDPPGSNHSAYSRAQADALARGANADFTVAASCAGAAVALAAGAAFLYLNGGGDSK